MQLLLSGQGKDVVTPSDFDKTSDPNWRPFLYSLCLFHCAANARRSYGPEGWKTPHVFSSNDLMVS